MFIADFFYWLLVLVFFVALGSLVGRMVAWIVKGETPYLRAKKHSKIYQMLRKLLQRIGVLACLLFVAGCVGNIPSAEAIARPCALVWGTESDWSVISDTMAESVANANDLCIKNGNPI